MYSTALRHVLKAYLCPQGERLARGYVSGKREFKGMILAFHLDSKGPKEVIRSVVLNFGTKLCGGIGGHQESIIHEHRVERNPIFRTGVLVIVPRLRVVRSPNSANPETKTYADKKE